jgi:hypothetical protein
VSDSEVSGGDEELSEEGLDWEELEKKAAKADKEQLIRHGGLDEEEGNKKAMRKRAKK